MNKILATSHTVDAYNVDTLLARVNFSDYSSITMDHTLQPEQQNFQEAMYLLLAKSLRRRRSEGVGRGFGLGEDVNLEP